MKKLLLILPVLLLFSCSVQKRKYQNGYYVEWHHKKSKSEQSTTTKKHLAKELKKQENTQVIEVNTGDFKDKEVSASKSATPFFKKHHNFKKDKGDTCDLLIFKDGSEISAKVNEVGISEIKYKRCDAPDGPNYVTRKSEIFMIKYANGTKEVFKAETPAPAPYVSSSQGPPVNNYRSNKYNCIQHPLSLPALLLGGASIIAAYILLFLALDSGVDNEAVLFLPFGLGLLAIILGAISLAQIKAQPDVYKGKGLSIPGMIMGIVIASIMLLVIFAVFLW